jgi:Sulfotransferase family
MWPYAPASKRLFLALLFPLSLVTFNLVIHMDAILAVSQLPDIIPLDILDISVDEHGANSDQYTEPQGVSRRGKEVEGNVGGSVLNYNDDEEDPSVIELFDNGNDSNTANDYNDDEEEEEEEVVEEEEVEEEEEEITGNDYNIHPAANDTQNDADALEESTTTSDRHDLGDSIVDTNTTYSIFHGGSNNVSASIAKLRRIVFAHVGKAGGASLSNILKAYCRKRGNRDNMLDCLESLPPSVISNRVKYIVHFVIKDDQPIQKADSFLFVMRNPVDRFLSWFHFVHPFGCRTSGMACGVKAVYLRGINPSLDLFVSCFPREIDLVARVSNRQQRPLQIAKMEQKAMAQQLLQSTRQMKAKNTSSQCLPLLHRLVRGKPMGHFTGHLNSNLEWYANNTHYNYPNKPILIIRTNNMWEDVRQIDIAMGGAGDFGKVDGKKETHNTLSADQRHQWTPEERKPLCCVLMREFEVYMDLLNKAINLTPEQIEETWQNDMNTCDASSWEDLQAKCEGLKYLYQQ